MSMDLVALLPEIFLLAGAFVTLLVGSFTPRHKQWRTRALAAGAVTAALAAAADAFATQPVRMVYDFGFAVDTATDAARLIVTAALLGVVAVSVDTVRDSRRETEFYVLAMLAGLGTLVMAGAADLLVLEVGILLTSIPVVALIGWARDKLGTEAAVKFFLLSALSTVTTAIGITIIFGAARTTSYRLLAAAMSRAPHTAAVVGVVTVIAGLLVEAGAVPMHFWLPDATEGTTAPAATFVTTVPKVGALVALYRLFADPLHLAPLRWGLLVGVIAALTMTLGNLAAFQQTSPRRLLAYSTVSQTGYLLMAVSVAGRGRLPLEALLFYLAAYAAANVGAFAVVAELPHAETLEDYAGLLRRHPGLAVTLLVCLLALVGTPPTAVFFGKLSVFSAAGGGGNGWLVVVAAVNTVASLFYYLRWLAPALLRPPGEGAAAALMPAGISGRAAAYTGGAVTLVLGLGSGAALALFSGALALR